jgi:hypothetical protein
MGDFIQTGESSSMIVLRMAESMQPEFQQFRNKDWMSYGIRDTYPDYVIDLFKKSAKHAAIVRSKVNYICGEGWKKADSEFNPVVNSFGETLKDVSKKCIMDMELHGGFYLERIATKGGGSELHHIDYRKYRSNADNTTFYFQKDGKFQYNKTKPVPVPAFDPKKNQPKSVIYFKQYSPGIDTYTVPPYLAATNYIEADIEVSRHTLGNAQCGFTPSKMITLPNGEPSEEQKRIIEKKFREKFTGSDGQKFIISFVTGADKKPIIDDLGASDLTKEDFTIIDNLISQNIFVAHQITSPMLFGVRVEGQLGGRNEMREAFEIFQNTYITARQQEVERVFSVLLGEELEIKPTEPMEFQFGEGIAAKNMTFKEIRDQLDVSDYPDDMDVDLLNKIDAIKVINPAIADRIVASMSDDELRSIAMLPPAAPQPAAVQLSEEDFVGLIGELKEDYIIVSSKPVRSRYEAMEFEIEAFQTDIEVLTATEELIISYLRKDPKVTPEIIAQRSKLSIDRVEAVMKSLEKRNYITVKVEPTGLGDEEVVSREPVKGIPTGGNKKEIGIKYSYEVRPDVPPAKSGSRPFCKLLMEKNRLYSRRDIEKISQMTGYDVWTHKGGWYHNPNTGKNEDECRHQWMSHITIRAK